MALTICLDLCFWHGAGRHIFGSESPASKSRPFFSDMPCIHFWAEALDVRDSKFSDVHFISFHHISPFLSHGPLFKAGKLPAWPVKIARYLIFRLFLRSGELGPRCRKHPKISQRIDAFSPWNCWRVYRTSLWHQNIHQILIIFWQEP